MKWMIWPIAAVSLSACFPTEPVVSDFNGASVKIQQSTLATSGVRNAATDAEAARICAKGSNKRAEYASTRQMPDYSVEHLYLCL